MKFAMILLLSVSSMTLINGDDKNDCMRMCNDVAESGIQKSFSQSIVCKYAQNNLDCFKNTCGLEVASHVREVEEMLRSKGYSCDLSGSSALSGSLLIVLLALLITTYRALI
ncbi:uncharacterized protein LOC112569376 isoform X2 [Pomacea canaliculata]|uniref:uncharacterized protein LOC112569376 isoform X2 n=1 Tax=Pomacea canaliculata TaxID=400727 RepID=UPI000D72AE8E|nr:uncharacterized protein LOC112569376 isoform X2 [Pomacea canaliculata]